MTSSPVKLNKVTPHFVIYNSSGQDLNTPSKNSKYGDFRVCPPTVVENENSGKFIHAQKGDTTISEGYVAYKGKIKDTPNYCIQLFGWKTTSSNHTVHCDIFLDGPLPTPEKIYNAIETNPQSDVKKIGIHVTAGVDDGIAEYTVTPDDAA